MLTPHAALNCSAGLRKLEKALELSPYTSSKSPSRIFDPQIQYLPFQLDPTLPNDRAFSKSEMYAKKFGADRFDGMVKMMKQRGKDVGIDLCVACQIACVPHLH